MNDDRRRDVGKRLEQLDAILASDSFLSRQGLGNEIPFYIFAYDAACDPLVSSYLPKLKAALAQNGVKVVELHLYQLVLDILESRGVLQKSFALEADKGVAAVEKPVRRLIVTETLIKHVQKRLEEPHDLVFVTGVGAAWPLVRSHTVLNNLHPVVNDVPLVMFYPGTYTGQGLQLFSSLTDDNYYRAFPLPPPAAS